MFEFDTTWFDMVCHGHGHLYGHSTAQRVWPIWLVSDVTFIEVEIKVGKEIKFKSVGENNKILILAQDIKGLKTRK